MTGLGVGGIGETGLGVRGVGKTGAGVGLGVAGFGVGSAVGGTVGGGGTGGSVTGAGVGGTGVTGDGVGSASPQMKDWASAGTEETERSAELSIPGTTRSKLYKYVSSFLHRHVVDPNRFFDFSIFRLFDCSIFRCSIFDSMLQVEDQVDDGMNKNGDGARIMGTSECQEVGWPEREGEGTKSQEWNEKRCRQIRSRLEEKK